MKHLNKLFAAVVLFAGLTSQAQDSNNPWVVSFGVNGVDTRVSASRSGLSFLDKQFSQTFDVSDNWNMIPSISYITVNYIYNFFYLTIRFN